MNSFSILSCYEDSDFEGICNLERYCDNIDHFNLNGRNRKVVVQYYNFIVRVNLLNVN